MLYAPGLSMRTHAPLQTGYAIIFAGVLIFVTMQVVIEKCMLIHSMNLWQFTHCYPKIGLMRIFYQWTPFLTCSGCLEGWLPRGWEDGGLSEIIRCEDSHHGCPLHPTGHPRLWDMLSLCRAKNMKQSNKSIENINFTTKTMNYLQLNINSQKITISF